MAAADKKPAAKAPTRERMRLKLFYKKQRELEALPGAIWALEAQQKALGERMSVGDYYKLGAEETEVELMGKLERREKLDNERAG